MKVTHFNKGYALQASEHEMAWLRAMAQHIIWSGNWEQFTDNLSIPQLRSLRRHMNGGKILRTNTDRRSGQKRGEVYDGPHNDC